MYTFKKYNGLFGSQLVHVHTLCSRFCFLSAPWFTTWFTFTVLVHDHFSKNMNQKHELDRNII